MGSSDLTRRNFLHSSATKAAALTTATSVLSATSYSRAANGGNQRLRIGFIGTGGRGMSGHVSPLSRLYNEMPIELAGVCDVYSVHRDYAMANIRWNTDSRVKVYDDYRDMIADDSIDAVCIGTPDHWHAKQAIDALKAGKHVYCEKPMTHTIEEAFDVVNAWKESGKVMQVGVQSTALDIWNKSNELICQGKLGKMLMFQTEYFRNSDMGQWRYYRLSRHMTPKTIDWPQWLGTEEGLADDMPFDRAIFAQWRRFWPFGSGMFTDLFVHRTTSMLKATGLRFPSRVVGAGGIYLEYDGRDVPDVASVVADYAEGAQGLITATMCCANTPVRQVIRGHHGSFVYGNGENFSDFKFVAERPQVTHDSSIKDETIETTRVRDSTLEHQRNFVQCCLDDTPEKVNCPPDIGAAAIVTVNLGSRSYREGKAFHFDPETYKVTAADDSWANRWEKKSKNREKPEHIPGWKAGDKGSLLVEPSYQKLEGPWIDGKDPAGDSSKA